MSKHNHSLMFESAISRPGTLIAIEGLSFSGKTTAIRFLQKELQKRGEKIVVVEWNAITSVKRMLNWLHKRGWLTPIMYCLIQWGLCVFVYFRRIRPALAENSIVLADRYIHTGLTRDTVNSRLSGWLSSMLYKIVRKPDWVLFFSVPPRICIASMNAIPSSHRSLFYLCKWIKKLETAALRDLIYLQHLDAAYQKIIANKTWLRLKSGNVVILDGHTRVNAKGLDPWIPMVTLEHVNQEISQYRNRFTSQVTFCASVEMEKSRNRGAIM